MPEKHTPEEAWYRMLTQGDNVPHRLRRFLALLPSSPRCKLCNAPFKGWGGYSMHLVGRDQSRFNPRYCEPCEVFDHPGGAEVELTMLFADVRGSSKLAEQMSALQFSQLINRFYVVATDVLVRHDAMVDRLIGDEVVGLFVPGLAGPQHARLAVQAACSLLQKTGHQDREGPWIPVGIGVHTGKAFVGVVGGSEDQPTDFTALGDNVNITAGLADQAGTGEILISRAAYEAAGQGFGPTEHRELALKGKDGAFEVYVLKP
ncbi:MAG: adenylate/guanylate cyclase domain-containing protein [Chloroflexi bacterium]|nr:adenylate/guanylate cyclase domain-containing protein [Chloroflexota bacterium]